MDRIANWFPHPETDHVDNIYQQQISVPEKGWFKKALAFAGPGILISIAYIDPGNIETNLQAGASYRYLLIWTLAVSIYLGLILQILAARLGIVSARDLASACRLSYPQKMNIFLWLMAEISVICADIPEVIGTAVALKLLFGIPLWAGVLLTGIDTLIFLLFEKFNIRFIEYVIALMVAIVSFSFVFEMALIKPPFVDVIKGFIPMIPDTQALMVSIAVLGSNVMPHNLFLHSSLVCSRQIERTPKKMKEAIFYNIIESSIALSISFIISFSIVVLAGTKFLHIPNIGLESAYNLLYTLFSSSWAANIFAIGLLASGQSSILTSTYAGQFIMNGFLKIQAPLWMRNTITRTITILPCIAFVLISKSTGGDQLIIITSCLLSVILPFSIIPLIKMTSNAYHMGDEFVNSYLSCAISWALGASITIANCVLLVSTILDLTQGFNWWMTFGIFIVVVILLVLYCLLIVYMIWLPVDLPLSLDQSDISSDNNYSVIPDQKTTS